MRQFAYLLLLAAVFTPLVFFAGCGSVASPTPASNNADHDHGHNHDGDDHDGHGHSHEHGDKGPHGGHLIELGHNHRYHAELLGNDATESVTVYILDTHMKELPIGERLIFVSLTVSGETTAYEMVAVGDGPNEHQSRFVSPDKALFRALEQGGEVFGKLRVTIEGVSYVGRIAHHDRALNHSTHRH